ncbi:hypothetical protein [Conyzicola sp.]|uniref:hypothetical protein n=1 Tax=Conyzicola sp. TaxID=1969404 RepID=UPI003989F329
MDDLTLLRKVRETVSAPAYSLDEPRTRLAAAMAHESDKTASRSTTRVRWAGAVTALAAAAIVGTLVATNVTGSLGGSGSATASEVLNDAAELSATATDFKLSPGQYLMITTTTRHLTRVGASGIDVSGWLTEGQDVLYVPAERADDWVWVRDTTPESAGGVVLQYFGTGGEQAHTDLNADVNANPRDPVWVLPGGNFTGAEDDSTVYGLGPSPETATMPRDAKQLLAWYRERNGTSPDDDSGDYSIFDTISESLRWNLVPADLRAAMFQAIALMPAVTLTDNPESSVTATLQITNGKHRQELTIDTTTGLVTATAQYSPLLNSDGTSIYPEGTPISTTTVTTTVVDAAP